MRSAAWSKTPHSEKLAARMPEATTDRLQIAYIGPALEYGRMPMAVLAAGLRGQSLLIERVAYLLLGDGAVVQVEVDADFEAGSLLVPVHILIDGLHKAEHLLIGEGFTALSNLLGLLGFFGLSGSTLYRLFKRLKGRRIESPEDIPSDIHLDISRDILIRIYNDGEVQTQLRRALEPLRSAGVEQFQTRRAGIVIDTVAKGDLESADEAELDDLTRDDEVVLDIEKVALKRSLSWHLSDGQTSFDARIEDDSFWKSIARGEAFTDGDRLRVHLRTTAKRTRFGTLQVQRVIPRVISVDHVRRQRSLFEEF